jgi:hypothetical protein
MRLCCSSSDVPAPNAYVSDKVTSLSRVRYAPAPAGQAALMSGAYVTMACGPAWGGMHRSSPAFSLGSRTELKDKSQSPAPNAYGADGKRARMQGKGRSTCPIGALHGRWPCLCPRRSYHQA